MDRIIRIMKSVRNEFSLTAAGINGCCNSITSFAAAQNMPHTDIAKIALASEEALLAYRDRFGEETQCKLLLEKRMGKLHMSIDIKADAFNPVTEYIPFDSDYPEISGLMENFVLTLNHSYKNGVNRISCTKAVVRSNSFLVQILIALIAGFAFGFLSRLLPAGIGSAADQLLVLVCDTLMGLIKMAALPVIFLCTIKGITSCGGLASFGKVAGKTISAFFFTMFLLLLGTAALCFICFPLNFSMVSETGSSIGDSLSIIFTIFPDNIISPFNNGDNIKVLFIAILIGCAILALGEKSGGTILVISRLCDIATTVMEWVCKPMPVILFVLIVQNIRNPQMLNDAAGAWLPFLLVCAVFVIGIGLDAAIVAKKKGIPFGSVIRYIGPAFIKGFATTSSIMAYPDMEYALTKEFKTDSDYVDFALPLGCTFFQPSVILLSCVTLYFTSVSGLAIDPAWIISFLLFSFLSSIAVPPVTAGVVAMVTLMFSSLGVSSIYLALASSLLMLMDFPNTAGKIAFVMLEIARISDNE